MLLKLFGFRLLVTQTYFRSARRFYVQRTYGCWATSAVEARVGPLFGMFEWGCSTMD
jgi:hypothetical protein